MFVSLKGLSDRKLSADQIIGRLRRKLAGIAGATLFLQAVQDVRAGGRATGAQYQYTLQGDQLDELVEWSPRLYNKLKTLPGITDVNSDLQNQGREVALDIDRSTASRLGLSLQTIDNTLYDAFGQRQVSTMFTQLNQYHVVMGVDPQLTQSPDGLKYIYLPAGNGTTIPLNAFARYKRDTTPLSVNHQSQFPSTTLSFNLRPGTSLSEAVDLIQAAQ